MAKLMPLLRIAFLVLMFFASCVAASAQPTTKPSTMPTIAQLPGLGDAILYSTYRSLYPDPAIWENNGISSDDTQMKLKEALWAELDARGANRLKSFFADMHGVDSLAKIDEPGLFILLHGAIRRQDELNQTKQFFTISQAMDADALASPTTEPKDQLHNATASTTEPSASDLDPIVRKAIMQGGHLRDVALDHYQMNEMVWMSNSLVKELLPQTRTLNSTYGSLGGNRERLLCEILSRGGTDWEKTLADEVKQIEQTKLEPLSFIGKNGLGYLPTLTALRRLEKKADPIGISVSGPANLECVFPSLPGALNVALVNQESDNLDFTKGGDYRSGRQARWRIEARDAAGNMIPERPMFGFMGGGLFGEGNLAPGAKWNTQLNVGSFLPTLKPGEYNLRVLYHDSMCIADLQSLDGLIVYSSPTIRLTVKPLEIDKGKMDATSVLDLLSAVDEKAKLQIVAGTYGPWAYDAVPLDSAQGKLLTIGAPAIPTLIDALDDPKLTPQRRAVVLSLLYSLTGDNDPTDAAGVVGTFKKTSGPWAVFGDGGGGFGGGGVEDFLFAVKIDEPKQIAFAKRWAEWKQYILIVPTKRV